MKALAKALAWALLLTAVVWAATTVYWSRTHRAITQADVVLYLVALPLVVVLGFFLLRWAWRSSGDKVAARAASASTSIPAGTAPAVSNPAADERSWSFKVLTQWVNSAAGQDAAAVWTAVREAEVRPQPDPDLIDDDGPPVFATRVEGLDAEATRTALADLPGAAEALLTHEPSNRLLRSLGLLADCGDWLATTLAVWADAQAQLAPAQDGQRPSTVKSPALTVVLMLAADLPTSASDEPNKLGAEPALAQAWLAPQLGAIETFDPRLHRVLVRTTTSAADTMAWADQQLLAWRREQRTGLLLLLVADSLIDETVAARLSRSELLMSGRQPKGATLGEAAVGLLLATPDWPAPSAQADFTFEHPPVALHRWAQRRREQSADEAGRVDPEVARDVLGDALQASAVLGDAVMSAVSDADLRPSRTTEWYGAMLQHMGHLDATQDVVTLGVALGDCGVAQAALCVALAAQRAASEQHAVVAATVISAHERGAVVLQPAPLAQQITEPQAHASAA